ncbi:MAG: outer membrane protein assembly factor BamA, partial [Betaproteobacteria bacterium]
DINRSKQRLDLLGFFSEVRVDTRPIEGRDDQVDLEVSVIERQTGSFSVGIGYSSLDGVLLQASLNQQNFLGTGNALGLNISSGRVNETYAVSFTDPYITDEGVSRTTTISKKDTDLSSLVVSSFQSSTYAAKLSFGVPVSEYDRVFYGIGAEQTELTIFSNSPRVYREFVSKNGTKNTVYPLNIGWSRDKRDSSFYPTDGLAQKFNAELSTPAGDLTYYSGQYTLEWYRPLTKNTTLHLEGSVSYSEDYDNNELPFYKNYYAGGGRTVRGYQTSSIGPQNEFGEAIGGKRRLLATGEWLFPFPGLEKDRSMRLALFVDAGGVENSFDDALSDMRYSSGLGFLWYSPLGPMRFSFAKTLNDEATDRTEKFQFTLGTTF